MTIYQANDILVVNTAYTTTSLPNEISKSLRQQTLASLSILGMNTVTVLDTGNAGGNRPYIKVLTSNQANQAHRSGNGITIYFDNATQIDNSFEYSKAFIKDKCVFKVLNSTGSTISKNVLVYQNGFDTVQQLPTVALASASSSSTAVVLGITSDEIADGACGTVVSEGSIILDTSSYTAEGDAVYLSDTPGATSTTAGTETVVVGRILCVGNPGSLSIFSTLTSGANSGGSGGGGGGGSSFTMVDQTTDFTTASGNIYTTNGASGLVTATLHAATYTNGGAPEEVQLIATTQPFDIYPPSGETLSQDHVANVGADEGVRLLANNRCWAIRSSSNTWTLTAVTSLSEVVAPYQITDVTNLTGLMGVTGSDFNLRIRSDADDTVLGTIDETSTFTDGSTISLGTVYLEIESTGTTMLDPGEILQVGGSPTSVPLQVTMPGQEITDTNNTYWIDTNGNLYVRGQNGLQEDQSFLDATATGTAGAI